MAEMGFQILQCPGHAAVVAGFVVHLQVGQVIVQYVHDPGVGEMTVLVTMEFPHGEFALTGPEFVTDVDLPLEPALAPFGVVFYVPAAFYCRVFADGHFGYSSVREATI